MHCTVYDSRICAKTPLCYAAQASPSEVLSTEFTEKFLANPMKIPGSDGLCWGSGKRDLVEKGSYQKFHTLDRERQECSDNPTSCFPAFSPKKVFFWQSSRFWARLWAVLGSGPKMDTFSK